MNIFLSFFIASLPLLFWWRFRDTPLDRDFMPYAGPGVFKAGYLENGFIDIKPPLIHWSYKLWLGISSKLRLPQMISLRLLPSLMISVSILGLGLALKVSNLQLLIMALLLCSPTLWPHMANTEWLTVILLSASVALSSQSSETFLMLSWMMLGLLPLVNQKNILLLVPVAWALELNLTPIIPHALALAAPGLLVLCYTLITKRFNLWRHWLIGVPAAMGQRRTIKANTMPSLKVLMPCLCLMAPIIACSNWRSPWALVALIVIGVMILSKQITPHHFILLALPISLMAQPSILSFVGFAIVWCFRDGLCWFNPKLIYKVTFPNYETRLADAAPIEKWLRENTAENEVIWVNGMENQIYLNALRRPWRIEIPELLGVPDGDPPRVIVHCGESFKKFDYEKWDYETVQISNMGFFTIVKREVRA